MPTGRPRVTPQRIWREFVKLRAATDIGDEACLADLIEWHRMAAANSMRDTLLLRDYEIATGTRPKQRDRP